MALKKFSIVVAAHVGSNGIGLGNQIPWRIKEDMAFFKSITSTTTSEGSVNAVIMGRKTWESLPERFRPLPSRLNLILSRDPDIRSKLSLPTGVYTSTSLNDALELLSNHDIDSKVENIFVIGGGEIYNEALSSPLCSKVYFTEVHGTFPKGFDAFFPTIPASRYFISKRSPKIQSSEEISYRFVEYDSLSDEDEPPIKSLPIPTYANAEEMQYLNLIQDILTNGVIRGDRTGTGTISKFGVQMRFSLRDNIFPMITTKRVFWRGLAEELLWFVKGTTNANELREKDIHIWDGNASREFLDSRGLHHREAGDLGPVYGFQWRHFGAKYVDMHTNYDGQGIDQLKDCIDKIKNSPEDRRIIMTAWNPADLNLMALPPCHMFCQFYVANNELSCHMYQRSADMGLGVPFNIASYSLLTRMVAQVCGIKAGDFVHSIGDAHVYLNHIDALKVQLNRQPKPFPKLFLNEEVKDIDSFTMNDFKIEGYNPDGPIKMTMAV